MERPTQEQIDALVDGLMPLHRPKPEPANEDDAPAEKPKTKEQSTINQIIR